MIGKNTVKIVENVSETPAGEKQTQEKRRMKKQNEQVSYGLARLRTMPKMAIFSLVMVVVLITASPATASVIVDGTAPGYVNDGSFETEGVWLGSGSNLASDLGINRTSTYRSNAGTIADGTQYVLVGPNGADQFGVYLDTGYDLVGGETFDLSFSHKNHVGVGGSDSMIFRFFTRIINRFNLNV